MLAGTLGRGQAASHDLSPGRHAWVQVARGKVLPSGHPLEAGDGAAVSGEAAVLLEGIDDAEVLVLDLA